MLRQCAQYPLTPFLGYTTSLHMADVTLAVDACCPAIQVPHADSEKMVASLKQHTQSGLSSQATGSVASSMPQQQTSSHTNHGCAVSRQPTPIDVERSGAPEQVAGSVTAGITVPSDQNSVSPPYSSQPVLLPAGVTSATPSQLSNDASAQSPGSSTSMAALVPTSLLQQTTVVGSSRHELDSTKPSPSERPAAVISHQLDFLMTDDPVATAIAEANKVVANRAGLMSLADQRREALNLHIQAKDTYFAAAQTAHEKGNVVRHCMCPQHDTAPRQISVGVQEQWCVRLHTGLRSLQAVVVL